MKTHISLTRSLDLRRRWLAGVALLLAGLAAPSAAAQNTASYALDAPRIFFLNLRGQVLSMRPDGADLRVLADNLGTSPDGIAVDPAAGHVYWSNMGEARADDGSIMRSDLDGRNVTTIVARGGTFTAKQLTLDAKNRKLYWSDREGMRVQRVNLDGTGLETLVEIATGDVARANAANWAVGIAVDADRGHVYWTQKGGGNEGVGSIRRASIDIPAAQTAADRTDIEILFASLPEPIDLALDLTARQIYWTDRGDAPRGNTVNRAPMDPPAGFDPGKRTDSVILLSDLREAIGIALDRERNRLFVTDLGGNIVSARLDGSDRRTIATGLGSLTGIAVSGPASPSPE